MPKIQTENMATSLNRNELRQVIHNMNKFIYLSFFVSLVAARWAYTLSSLLMLWLASAVGALKTVFFVVVVVGVFYLAQKKQAKMS